MSESEHRSVVFRDVSAPSTGAPAWIERRPSAPRALELAVVRPRVAQARPSAGGQLAVDAVPLALAGGGTQAAELEVDPALARTVDREAPSQEPISEPVADLASSGHGGKPIQSSPTPSEVALEQAIRALGSVRSELVARIEVELADLVVEVARALLEAELAERPELHGQLVRTAVAVLGTEGPLRVRVSPETFDVLSGKVGGRVLDIDGQRIELEPDPALRGHGAIVEAGGASVDGMMETRLARVRAALRRTLRGAVEAAA